MKPGLPSKIKIMTDEQKRDHYRLGPEDEVYYFGEWTKGKLYDYSHENQFIQNFKIKPRLRSNPMRYRHKEIAISGSAAILRKNLKEICGGGGEVILVPIPPSKAKGDDGYDDRLSQVCEIATKDTAFEFAEVLTQRESTRSSHESDARLSVEELLGVYEIDETLIDEDVDRIVLIDDMVTAGTHFKAAKSALLDRYPRAQVIGVFLTRRVPDPDAAEAMFADIDLSELLGKKD